MITVGPTLSWRLIYNDSEIIHLFQSDNYTTYKYYIEEFETQEQAIMRMNELGLTYSEQILEVLNA